MDLPIKINKIQTKPFSDQKPGTSGLRKKVNIYIKYLIGKSIPIRALSRKFCLIFIFFI